MESIWFLKSLVKVWWERTPSQNDMSINQLLNGKTPNTCWSKTIDCHTNSFGDTGLHMRLPNINTQKGPWVLMSWPHSGKGQCHGLYGLRRNTIYCVITEANPPIQSPTSNQRRIYEQLNSRLIRLGNICPICCWRVLVKLCNLWSQFLGISWW